MPASDAPAEVEEIPVPEATESTAPPSEPGGAPSGFEAIETPASLPPPRPNPRRLPPNPRVEVAPARSYKHERSAPPAQVVKLVDTPG